MLYLTKIFEKMGSKLNARNPLSSADEQREIAFIDGKLSNKLIISPGDDAPLLGNLHFEMTERPRTIAFEIVVLFERGNTD